MRIQAVLVAMMVIAPACDGPDESNADSPVNGGPKADNPGGDANIVRRLLDGEANASDVVRQISLGGGWPTQLDSDLIFVRVHDGGEPYAVAGDFNDWMPTPMEVHDGFSVFRLPVDRGHTRYKLVDVAGNFAADPIARRYNHDDNGQISYARTDESHLERWPDLGNGDVTPRTLRVWVPSQPATHQLYAHDGQNLFDPRSTGGGWRLQSALGPTTMVVGVDNVGAGRLFDYTPVQDLGTQGGGGDAYADYIQHTVRPFIQDRYGEAERVGVMGSSLGGLISVHIARRFPGAFDFAASLSGTMGFGSFENNAETMIHRFARDTDKLSAVLYLDSGGGLREGEQCVDRDGDGVNDDGLTSTNGHDNYCANIQLRDLLAGQGYTFETELFHFHEPGAPHNEAAWAQRVFRPIDIFEAM